MLLVGDRIDEHAGRFPWTSDANLSPPSSPTILRANEGVRACLTGHDFFFSAVVHVRTPITSLFVVVLLQPLETLDVINVPKGNEGVHFMSTLAVSNDGTGGLNFLEGCYHMYVNLPPSAVSCALRRFCSRALRWPTLCLP